MVDLGGCSATPPHSENFFFSTGVAVFEDDEASLSVSADKESHVKKGKIECRVITEPGIRSCIFKSKIKKRVFFKNQQN